jgi:2-desacetyl-2-hydroxyethyl bacteriochlorophyllide A dehydrogenase
MKAMVLTAPGHVEMQDLDTPVPAAGEALIRITHSGICGTDRKIFDNSIPVAHPLIMGHEMIGVVEEGGDVAPGTRVLVDPVMYCGNCFHCRAGQTHLCPTGLLKGRDQDGGFAEYVTAPSDHIYPLPDDVGDKDAALIQVLTTCMHAQRMAPVAKGETVIVFGLGVTGQLHVQLAKAHGAGQVIGITRSQWKRELAEELGADLTLAPGPDTKDRVLELTEGRGADLVIETTGSVSVLAQALDLARIGGRVMPFSIYTASEAPLPFYQFYFKELNIINARAAKGEDFPASIEMVRSGKVRLEPLITHAMPLADIGTALEMLNSTEQKTMKIILEHT